jgi:hypothetical protein
MFDAPAGKETLADLFDGRSFSRPQRRGLRASSRKKFARLQEVDEIKAKKIWQGVLYQWPRSS